MYKLKSLFSTLSIIVLIGLVITGCDTLSFEEPDKLYDGDVKVKFSSNELTLFAEEDQDNQTIEVSTLRPVSEDRTYSFTVVDDQSTAVAGEDYTIQGTEFTIAANEVIGQLPITLIKESLADAPTLQLQITGESAAAYNTTIVVTLRQFFPYVQSDFTGDYQLVYPWWFDDSDPRTVTAVAGDDENTIIVQNMLGSGTDIEFTMDDSDPANFTVSFDREAAWVSGNFGEARMFGTGTFDAENIVIQANATHTVSAGSFGTNPFTMTKIVE